MRKRIREQGRPDEAWHRWPTILDAVFLASGTGFVGTEGSTSPSFLRAIDPRADGLASVSEIAIRRVEDWNGGITAQVHQWDRLGT